MTTTDVAADLDVRPLTTAIGAEIHGVDLSVDLDDATIAAIRQVWLDRCVVFFRDQDITKEQQVRFATRFAPVQQAVFENTASDEPGLTVINMESPRGSGTDVWHADSTFMAAPPLGAVLRAVRLPAVGGDTCFASMYAAYDLLSPTMQHQLDGLTAVHSTAHVMALVRRLDNATVVGEEDIQRTVHPVVRVHPETGRKLLFVSPNWVERIVELEDAESASLLAFLYEHVKSPEIQCRFKWDVDSVAFWDNRACQHYAVADYHEQRTMNRVLLAGDVPFGPS
jgi:alpha-ketoglutarate-dependent taurine dioxygenase